MDLNAIAILLKDSTPDGVCCHSAAPELGNGSSTETETALLLYSLVRRFLPRFALETGTNFGFTASWIALAMKDGWIDYQHKEKPHLYTVDSSAYDGKPEALWGRCGVSNFITHAIADSREYNIPVDKLDFIFFDADHSVSSIVSEWERFAPLLNRERALVLFHDTSLDVRAGEAMRLIIDGRLNPLPAYKHVTWLPLRNMRGLDIVLLSNENY